MAEQLSTPGAVLREAERDISAAGHCNLGPLSSRYGFLPAPGSHALLPPSHTPWDDLAAELPELHRGLTLRAAVDQMPMLPADPAALPDRSLQRAAMVLGLLAHAYFHLSPSRPAPPPPVITVPWAEVCRRLGRSGPYLSYLDLIVCNWRLRDPAAADPMRVNNLRLLIPTVDNEEEHIFYLTQTEILARTAPAVTATVVIDDAIRHDNPDGVAAALDTITAVMGTATRTSLPTINPRPDSRSHVDPVVWARTVAPFAVPIAAGALGPSGTASPLFNLLDNLFQRPTQHSQLGREILGHRAAYPLNWRRFLTAVDSIGLGSYVERAGHPRLTAALSTALEAYAGQTGFLSRHRRKVFGYLEIAFKVGRGVTIGGFAGAPQDRTWIQVDAELEKSRVERGAAAATSATSPIPTRAAEIDDRYPLSELVKHNDDENGYWITIDGDVYDVSEFLRRHPGGPMVLAGYAGRDATQAYHRLHSSSAAAAAALRRYKIGRMSAPAWVLARTARDESADQSGSAGEGELAGQDGPVGEGELAGQGGPVGEVRLASEGGAVGPSGLAGQGGCDSPLIRLWTTWAGLLGSTVDMQNALRQDYSLRRGVGLSHAPEDPRSPYLLERSLDTFERFVTHYLRPITGAMTDLLWPAATAAFPDAVSADRMRHQMDKIRAGSAAAAATALPTVLRDDLRTLVSADAGPHEGELRHIAAACERLAVACTGFLSDLKRLLLDGLLLLERAPSAGPLANRDIAIQIGTGLASIAEQLPVLLTDWLQQVAELPLSQCGRAGLHNGYDALGPPDSGAGCRLAAVPSPRSKAGSDSRSRFFVSE